MTTSAVKPLGGDFIEHDGRWWRKVARKAVYDDCVVIINRDGDEDYSIGDVLRVKISEAFAEFFDNKFGARHDQYLVLEPLGTVDDIHVHEGAAYRKVARKAQVGELVLITDAVITRDLYANGDVLTVSAFAVESGRGVNVREFDGIGIWYTEYVVLEPLTDPVFASLAQLPREITLSDVYEVYAHGKRAMAKESFEAEELRYKHDSRRLREALANEDIAGAMGFWTMVLSHHEKMTYWRKEIEKWDSEISRCKNR